MPQDKVKPGDLVMLKSGGPPMTVQSSDGEAVWAQWFSGKKVERSRFQLTSLILLPDEPSK